MSDTTTLVYLTGACIGLGGIAYGLYRVAENFPAIVGAAIETIIKDEPSGKIDLVAGTLKHLGDHIDAYQKLGDDYPTWAAERF
jgi:hypothetical protein